MNLYTSDLHLGHKNVLRFDHRPFSDIEEMNNVLTKLWNNRVSHDDDVWILGDICYKSAIAPETFLKRLKGHKHLIIGNHDGITIRSKEATKHFESIDYYKEIDDNGTKVVLSHYPILDWNGRYHGTSHIYGHIHGDCHHDIDGDESTFEIMYRRGALNAGCMINNYSPASMRELIENNKRFAEENFVQNKCNIKGQL